MSKQIYLRSLPLVILFLIGFVSLTTYFIQSPIVTRVESNITDVASVIAGYSAFVGLFALIKRHTYEARRRIPGQWFLSIWAIIVAVFVVLIGITYGSGSPAFSWFFSNIYFPIRVSASAIFIFATVNVLYKNVIFKDRYSAVFIISMVTLMLTNAPTFSLIIGPLKPISDWLLVVLNTTARRTLEIGAGVGMALTGFKIIFGRQAEFIKGASVEE